MQLLANGRDHVAETYGEGNYQLHRLVDGTYQFGTGAHASVIQTVEQVAMFNESIQSKVEQWLASGGYERAIEAKRTLDLADSAKAMPGSLEAAILAKGGSTLLGQIHALVAGTKYAPEATPPVPEDVLRPDPKAKVILADEEEDREDLPSTGIGYEQGGPWDPAVTATQMAETWADEAASKEAARMDVPPPPPDQFQQDVLASMSAISEAVGGIIQRLQALESKPAAKPAPAKKRVRPSRAKAKATPAPVAEPGS